MTDKLPRISPDKVIKVIEKLGFFLVRQSGSHRIYKNQMGIRITVPYHAGKTLHPKVLKNILKDIDISIEEFNKML